MQKFWYDANGNMITRIEGSTTYTQVFDVENRLTSVTPSGGSATTFAYDANGIRTKTVQPGGVTTYFPFPGYEETVNGANTIKRSTYSFAGQTIAMRVSGDPVSGNNGLFYVLSDHLGSTSVLSNSSGSLVAGSTTRYLPYGGYRTTPTQIITDRDFTGQKENMEVGLLYYQARFYVPGIGRFASADTIVPDPASPPSFNRFSYVLNNPIRYSDPTGHLSEDEIKEFFGFNSFQETVDAFGDAVAALLWSTNFTWGDVMAYTCEACEGGFGHAMLLLVENAADSESFRGAFWGLDATHYGLDYSGVEVTSALGGKPEHAFSDPALAQQYEDYSNIPINLERYGLEYGDMYAGSWTDVNGKMLLAHGGILLFGGFPIYNGVLEGYGYAEDFVIEPIFGVEPLGDLIQGYYPVIRPRSQWGWQYYSTISLSPPGGS